MDNIENKIYSRPWGSYQTIKLTETTQVKWIIVNPNQKLSLQKHFKRTEHWVVVKGTATITLNGSKKDYNINDHIYIPNEALHRIENLTKEEVILVEIQIGSYLGEDDIVRYDDIYGRN